MIEKEIKKFPKDFFWGAATASYQVEGGIDNTDWAKAAGEGRVPVCGKACDHYNRYEQDFDIAKELGHNAHRFSVEWARIEPKEGEFNESAVAHYREVLRALRARGLRPFITLWHFTLPLWFSESGGFERKDSPEIFARYCAFVVKELGDLCQDFTTINEPIVFASNGWLRGYWPPFKRFSLMDVLTFSNARMTAAEKKNQGVTQYFTYRRVRKNLARAHNRAYDEIKRMSAKVSVSIVRDIIVFDANWNPLNKLIAWFTNNHWNHSFNRRVHKKCDEFGLNYYFYRKFGETETYEKTDMGWNANPDKIQHALKMLARWGKPVFVSEAGLADEKDTLRAAYIAKQVAGVWGAIQDGVDVRGHFYWSLLDNYEWALGFEKRFGLVEINYETLERTIRPSALIYKQICEENAVQ